MAINTSWEGLEFHSRAGQIGHSVAIAAEMSPAPRCTLRNAASIMNHFTQAAANSDVENPAENRKAEPEFC